MRMLPLLLCPLTAASCLIFSPMDACSAPEQRSKLETTMELAGRGDAKAANTLGVWYEKGREGLAADPQAAVRWYRKAASGGSALAMHNLGDCYRDGIGVGRDHAEAFAWYRKAAAAGHAIGLEDLGDCYRSGVGVRPDLRNAEELDTTAAAQGRRGAKEKLAALRAGAPAPSAAAAPGPRPSAAGKPVSAPTAPAVPEKPALSPADAFLSACLEGRIDEVRASIRRGTDVNISNNGGMTGLMLAANAGRADVAKYLFESGALLDMRDNDGATAVMLAASAGHAGLVSLLCGFDAEVTPEDISHLKEMGADLRKGGIEEMLRRQAGK
ncbi:MAG: ankyrin repeat domain-containing protein [Mailhella sp.]|nr:ankyrin repeat domain-containing protein [Mailhella sp.]